MEKSTKNITPPHSGRLLHILRKVVSYLFPMAVSVALIVWLFHKVDIDTVSKILRRSCDYGWLIVMCVVLVLSRSVRGIRWGIQLRAAGIPRMPAFAEMVSIYGAYALNLILTGVGEAWRCIYVARRQRASLSTVVGTDLGDRISDAMMISMLIGLTLIVARPTLDSFMQHYSFTRHLISILHSPWLWIALALIAGVTLWILFADPHNKVAARVRTESRRLWTGFKILFTMHHQLLFWSYTLVIWIAYFMMTYLCFFAFPFTRELVRPDLAYGLLPGLVLFVFEAISIAIPATGGLGPWNLAVIFALTLFGVSAEDATAFSLVVWAFQTVTQIIMGIVGAIYISFNKKHLPAAPATEEAG